MEPILLNLQEYIFKTLLPNNLIRNADIEIPKEEWNKLWQEQSEKIKSDFTDRCDSKDDCKVSILTELISLSNRVQYYLTKYAKLWHRNFEAEHIRLLYHQVNHDIKLLIELLSGFNPRAFETVPYLASELPAVKFSLRAKLLQAERYLLIFTIDNALKSILTKTILWNIQSPHLTRSKSLYLLSLMDALLLLPILDTELLKLFLYQYNFNQPEVFMYWVNGWNGLLLEEAGVYEQMEILIMQRDHLASLRIYSQVGLLPHDEPLHLALTKYLLEKKMIVTELIELRRARFQDNEMAKSAVRFKTNLPVAQLGLFLRLQIEKGVLLKDNVGKLFSFYATHFYTPQTESISSQSLQKKSTEIEYATAQKLKALLISMINWLNENFKINE